MFRSVCLRCKRPESHCLCASIPALAPRTRVVVLQHPSEARHPLNTARLAVLGLAGARLLVGSATRRRTGWRPATRRTCCFPVPGAGAGAGYGRRRAGAAHPADRARRHLTHARKLVRLNPELVALPRVMLQKGLTSRYRVRHADIDGALSSIEAIVHALNAIEAPARFDALLDPFERMIDLQIEGMGEHLYARHHLMRKPRR